MFAEKLKPLISPTFDENNLIDILKQSTSCKQVIINNVNIADSSVTKGYSYLSSIIKFTIEGSARDGQEEEKKVECAVIVKTLPKNIGRRISFRSTDFFRNESIFYNKVWNALMKFQDSKNIKNKFNNIPMCFAAIADGKNDFIALEDLTAQSYTHFKREKELDYDCVLFIVKLFAKFHALSFAFKDQFPKEFEELADAIEETYFAEKFRNWYSEFHKTIIECSRDAIEKELPKLYLEKFDQLIKNDLFEKLCQSCGDRNHKLSVFTQGDAWIPNFLVKYQDNKLDDIKLIDFQLARCSSLMGELSFFLYSCASYELLNTHWDDIIVEYHKAFIAFLSELGSDPELVKVEDLQEEMSKNAVFGLGMSMEAMPFQMMDESDTPDLDLIEGDVAIPIHTVFRVYPIKNKPGRLKIALAHKHAIDRGFL